MRWLALLGALTFGACSSGSPVVPANLRGPVAIVAFTGMNPETPGAGLVPLLAVASFRGNELRLINAVTDSPVQAPNLAWPLGVPTVPRPQFLASGSLNDGEADLLVVASSEPRVQVVGTWMDGTSGYGIASTIDLTALAGPGSQIFSLAVAAVPSGPPAGSPPVAPPAAGRAWIVVGLGNPGNPTGGGLLVLEMVRQPDGSIALGSTPVAKPLGFSPGGLGAAPDNVHLYVSTLDPIVEASGRTVLGVAEIDASGGLAAPWTVRGFDARGCGTIFIATAFVGERTSANFYTYGAPALRVYAGLDSGGCGPERAISCGVATFDPASGGLAADPAIPGPTGWPVPTQTYRTPMFSPAQPLAFGIAMPAQYPGSVAPASPYGSQVCWSPVTTGNPLPGCPSVTEEAQQPPFNGDGVGQRFMLTAPPTGQLWTSVTGLLTAADGLAYVEDLGRFGVVNASSMLIDDTMRVQAGNATTVGPVGPYSNSYLFGFPDGTAAVGLWLDFSPGGTRPVQVVYLPADLAQAIMVWPGFTQNEHFRVSYQGILPGFAQRRSVLGLFGDGTLYIGIQEAAVPSDNGTLPASSYWVTGAIVGRADLGVHTVEKDGLPGDITQFLIDNDPCQSTRPNWIPAGGTTPVYDPTKAPQAHEAVVQSLLPPDLLLYPGGALRLVPEADATLASEYACLVAWFQQPGNGGKVLTMFRNNPPPDDWPRGTWVRAGGFVLAGSVSGYAGRPVLDVRYNFAWAEEDGLSGEALSLARKARRFYYPSAYPNHPYSNYPLMQDPMEPGPVVGFRLGRYCPSTLVDCNDKTSPPARDAGVDFFTQSGVVGMSYRPTGTSGGNYVTSFDKSTIPGQEYRGRVFYGSFVGDALMMIPPGLDVGQSIVIR